MIFGHEDKIKIFRNLVKEGTLSHAYLFFGDSQIGKSSFAEALANFLELQKFELPSLPLIDSLVFAPNEKGVIGIEQALEIRRFLWMTPFRSTKRLVIVDGSEALTSEAESALLKIVEETPEMAVIIFIAYDPQAIFPPLLSRLTKVYFSRLSKEEIKKVLISEYKVSPKEAEGLAKNSFGRLGRALNLIKGGEVDEEKPDSEIEKKIFDLRNKDLFRNSSVLSWLLQRLELIRRYNLNMRLQKAAVNYKIGQ